MNIAIIPARGGSKRIPHKNIKLFCGKPIIAWSIEAAKKSNLFDRIIVSTDDPGIAKVSEEYGAEVPFVRPANLADDYATTFAVIAHAANWAIKHYPRTQAICCMYAASPFIQTQDLELGEKNVNLDGWKYSFPVTEYASSIYRSLKINKNGGMSMLYPDNAETRTQDLPAAFHDVAQFYWGKLESWLVEPEDFYEDAKPIIIPRWRVQDIDTLDDFRRAEIIAASILKNI